MLPKEFVGLWKIHLLPIAEDTSNLRWQEGSRSGCIICTHYLTSPPVLDDLEQ